MLPKLSKQIDLYAHRYAGTDEQINYGSHIMEYVIFKYVAYFKRLNIVPQKWVIPVYSFCTICGLLVDSSDLLFVLILPYLYI